MCVYVTDVRPPVGTILAAIALAAIGIGVVVWLLHKHKAATSLDEQKNMDDKEEWKRTMSLTNILDTQKRFDKTPHKKKKKHKK